MRRSTPAILGTLGMIATPRIRPTRGMRSTPRSAANARRANTAALAVDANRSGGVITETMPSARPVTGATTMTASADQAGEKRSEHPAKRATSVPPVSAMRPERDVFGPASPMPTVRPQTRCVATRRRSSKLAPNTIPAVSPVQNIRSATTGKSAARRSATERRTAPKEIV